MTIRDDMPDLSRASVVRFHDPVGTMTGTLLREDSTRRDRPGNRSGIVHGSGLRRRCRLPLRGCRPNGPALECIEDRVRQVEDLDDLAHLLLTILALDSDDDQEKIVRQPKPQLVVLTLVAVSRRNTEMVIDTVDRSSWLTVRQIADSLAVSEGTVRSWQSRGVLKSVGKAQRRGRNGSLFLCDVFEPGEVAALDAKRRKGAVGPPSDPGEIAAQAFELFDRGDELRKVVVKLRQRPEVVSELHDQWLDLGGAQVVLTKEARDALEQVIGPFEGIADLVRLVQAKIATTSASSAEPASATSDSQAATR